MGKKLASIKRAHHLVGIGERLADKRVISGDNLTLAIVDRATEVIDIARQVGGLGVKSHDHDLSFL